MSLWGKIFAILNIFAAVGFVVVAGMDWGQRERWAYAVFRHDLFLAGLPFDAKELDADGARAWTGSRPPRSTRSSRPAPATPMPTQQDEVKRAARTGRDEDQQRRRSRHEGPEAGPLPPPSGPHRQPQRHALIAYMASPAKDAAAEQAVETQLQADFNREFDGTNEVGADGAEALDSSSARITRLGCCSASAKRCTKTPTSITSPPPPTSASSTWSASTGAARAADDQSLVIQKMTDEAVSAYAAELKPVRHRPGPGHLPDAGDGRRGRAAGSLPQAEGKRGGQGEVNSSRCAPSRSNDLKKQLAVAQGRRPSRWPSRPGPNRRSWTG